MRTILGIALLMFGVQASAEFIVKGGPNWSFDSSKGAAINLPQGDEIIIGMKMTAFEKWRSSFKSELLLFKDYDEPVMAPHEGGDPVKKELEVYDARFAFVVQQPIEKFNESKLKNTNFMQQLDSTFALKTIATNQVIKSGDPKTDAQEWCTTAVNLCVQADFTFSDEFARYISLAYATLKRSNAPSSLLLQSELSFQENSRIKLYPSESRVLTQKTFYVDHYLQYGVTRLVFHKINERETLVVGMTTIGVQADVLTMGKEVLDVLGMSMREFVYDGAGFSSFKGFEIGLVPYTRAMAERLQQYFKNF